MSLLYQLAVASPHPNFFHSASTGASSGWRWWFKQIISSTFIRKPSFVSWSLTKVWKLFSGAKFISVESLFWDAAFLGKRICQISFVFGSWIGPILKSNGWLVVAWSSLRCLCRVLGFQGRLVGVASEMLASDFVLESVLRSMERSHARNLSFLRAYDSIDLELHLK